MRSSASRSGNRHLLCTLLGLLLVCSTVHAQSIWWEAEARAFDDTQVLADDGSSGAKYLDIEVHREPLGLQYAVDVEEPGQYQFIVRQAWPGRDMRYRWNDTPWVTMKKPAWLERQMDEEGVSWGWFTDGRFHKLPAGQQSLQVQLEPGGKDANGRWYPQTGFDCFILTADSFAPVATVRPGANVPETHTRSKARSARVLAFWSTARTLERVYQPGSIEHDGQTLPYRLLVPENPQIDKSYPLVVGLPSSGGRGTDNIRQLGACEPARILAGKRYREEYSCYVLVPQSPDWFSDEARPKVTEQDLPMLTLLLRLIDQMQEQHAIDPDRIYLTGQSLGGFGVCNAMERDADRFAAAVMVAGSMPEKGEHFASTPTWIFVGEHDARKGQAEATIQSIRNSGGEPRFTIIPGTGHVAWPKAYATESFWEWLFGQSRSKR
jgi:poly(3-hydroxybutyrate) depolymerase